MDKKLAAYKEKYQKKLRLNVILIALMTVLLIVFAVFAPETLKAEDSFDFQTGLLAGVLAMFILITLRSFFIFRDDTKLRREYIEEHDERRRHIRRLAGYPFVVYSSAAMLVIGSFIGYLSREAFIALIAAGMIQLLLSVLIKFVAGRSI